MMLLEEVTIYNIVEQILITVERFSKYERYSEFLTIYFHV